MLSRRGFLASVAASAVPVSGWAGAGNPAFIAAGKSADGTFVLCGLTHAGTIAFRIPLPSRGHAAAAHPVRAEAVAFARRPGRFAFVIDCATGAVLRQLTPPDGHHFYGHGAFLDGGRILVTTENAFESGQGRLGIWDVTEGYRRIDQIASGGIGPHEVVRLPGTEVLAVANGGIRTHPDHGRDKLNLDTMRPNLSLVSEGRIVDQLELSDPKLSIRHIAARSDGTVAIGVQSEHAVPRPTPMIVTYRRSGDAVSLGEEFSMETQGYVGSVAWSGDGTRIAATCPRGACAMIWDGAQFSRFDRSEVCGVAPFRADLAFTDGLGGFFRGTEAGRLPVQWDNHLVEVTT
ncbi:DUF1513 domain-containing protein [Jannaschia sp. 2305UL9-9]|uniref:DUF1513 domain-containing protein n=1 Tax=Jannaschia sp. 2305UL9-9 TaxID=3121638 RepID=UPI0035275271